MNSVSILFSSKLMNLFSVSNHLILYKTREAKIWRYTLVILSNEWNTTEFLYAGIAHIKGPHAKTKHTLNKISDFGKQNTYTIISKLAK